MIDYMIYSEIKDGSIIDVFAPNILVKMTLKKYKILLNTHLYFYRIILNNTLFASQLNYFL